MGRRSRERGRSAAGPPPAPARPPRRSSAERDAEARARLEPLAPGERPPWVTVAATLASVMAIANLVLVVAGYDVTGNAKPAAGVLGSVILGLAAYGMWRARYWAVLGFEVLLGATALQAFLSLLVASNVVGALLAITVLLVAGFLFYKLIRAMARIQMPRRPRADASR